MEEYTEKQVLEQVEKDLSGGVFSPESIYMRKDLLAKDTGRSLEDITASCLLAHSEILKDGSLLALPGTTTVKSKSASGGQTGMWTRSSGRDTSIISMSLGGKSRFPSRKRGRRPLLLQRQMMTGRWHHFFT